MTHLLSYECFHCSQRNSFFILIFLRCPLIHLWFIHVLLYLAPKGTSDRNGRYMYCMGNSRCWPKRTFERLEIIWKTFYFHILVNGWNQLCDWSIFLAPLMLIFGKITQTSAMSGGWLCVFLSSKTTSKYIRSSKSLECVNVFIANALVFIFSFLCFFKRCNR